jgi:hypothetical protein
MANTPFVVRLARATAARWRPLLYLGRNPLSLAGAALTTAAGVTLLGFWALEASGTRTIHPYAGAILFLGLPVVFVLGLVLMPAGAWWRHRRMRRAETLPEAYPRFDRRDPSVRRAVRVLALATVVNVAMMSAATYRGVGYMETEAFCGLTCHKVMAPQHTAFVDSPHARVGCVECHIGPGASWFVRSKLSGARQVLAVARGTYSRPIPSPVRELRPARETCEHCHWPRKFHGNKLVVRTRHADDEANTPLTTVLVLKIGGHKPGTPDGIHGRHLADAERVHYVSVNGRREVIPKVTYLDDQGRSVDYVTEDPVPPGPVEHRAMDCMDCHNRPTHAFELPERAVDRALAEGRISRQLPFVRKQSVALLRASYPDRPTAVARLAAGLREFYAAGYPAVLRDRPRDVDAAAGELAAIYQRNVFPDMKVGWGTYPNNIGHADFPGCFRCHDDKHRAADGRVISQDCNACHSVLAMDEEDPKVLTELGLR